MTRLSSQWLLALPLALVAAAMCIGCTDSDGDVTPAPTLTPAPESLISASPTGPGGTDLLTTAELADLESFSIDPRFASPMMQSSDLDQELRDETRLIVSLAGENVSTAERRDLLRRYRVFVHIAQSETVPVVFAAEFHDWVSEILDRHRKTRDELKAESSNHDGSRQARATAAAYRNRVDDDYQPTIDAWQMLLDWTQSFVDG